MLRALRLAAPWRLNESESCPLVLWLQLPEPCEHAHACACERVQRVRVCGRPGERERSDYAPIYTCYCFPQNVVMGIKIHT